MGSVGWLVRSARVSNGFLIFIGSEEPFIGTTFSIDLRNSQVYQQDPPRGRGSSRKPERRRLPRALVLERPASDGWNRPSPAEKAMNGPCAIESMLLESLLHD